MTDQYPATGEPEGSWQQGDAAVVSSSDPAPPQVAPAADVAADHHAAREGHHDREAPALQHTGPKAPVVVVTLLGHGESLILRHGWRGVLGSCLA